MGTSISQGSPTGRSATGQAWSSVKRAVAEGQAPEKVITSIGRAYTTQFGDDFAEKLVDKGVELTEGLIKNFRGKKSDLGEFIVETKKVIASNQANSFVAELAVTAAGSAIADNDGNLYETFKARFAEKIVDYAISRDLPETISTPGLPNLNSSENLFREVIKSIRSSRQPNETTRNFILRLFGGKK